MLSDIKFLIKKYLKNPVLIIAGSYLLYKFVNKWLKKESMAESIKIIQDNDSDSHSIIYDDTLKKYILIGNGKVYSSDNEDEIKQYANKIGKIGKGKQNGKN